MQNAQYAFIKILPDWELLSTYHAKHKYLKLSITKSVMVDSRWRVSFYNTKNHLRIGRELCSTLNALISE